MAIHVIPLNDLREHKELSTCECEPSIEVENGEIIIIHNSFDGRELGEKSSSYLSEQDKATNEHSKKECLGLKKNIHL